MKGLIRIMKKKRQKNERKVGKRNTIENIFFFNNTSALNFKFLIS